MLKLSAKHCIFCVIFQHYKNGKWKKGLFGFVLYLPVNVPYIDMPDDDLSNAKTCITRVRAI